MLSDLALFLVGQRPYTDYARAIGAPFLMHPAVHLASVYSETGGLPEHMGWKKMPRGDAAEAAAAARSTEIGWYAGSRGDFAALVGKVVILGPATASMGSQDAKVTACEERPTTIISGDGKRRRVMEFFFQVVHFSNPKICRDPTYYLHRRSTRKRTQSDFFVPEAGSVSSTLQAHPSRSRQPPRPAPHRPAPPTPPALVPCNHVRSSRRGRPSCRTRCCCCYLPAISRASC